MTMPKLLIELIEGSSCVLRVSGVRRDVIVMPLCHIRQPYATFAEPMPLSPAMPLSSVMIYGCISLLSRFPLRRYVEWNGKESEKWGEQSLFRLIAL